MLAELVARFWNWYDRHYRINLALTAGLFSLQIIHLIWLTTDIVLPSLFGTRHLFTEGSFARVFLALVDYTEIPALISASILYIRHIRRSPSLKHYLYLIFLNIQWAHLFWITDEVVLETLLAHQVLLSWNIGVAISAIAIDYLELPVIYETVKEFSRQFVTIKK